MTNGKSYDPKTDTSIWLKRVATSTCSLSQLTPLEAIPSMKPLLGAYSSSIANSVPRLPYKQRKLEQLMNTIIAAHFSKPLHTAAEMKSFMDYHFPDQQTPGTLRWPAFPRDIESINYLIAVRLALEYIWYCVQDDYPSNEISWVASAFLRLQLHTELFYPSTDNSDPELPGCSIYSGASFLNAIWSPADISTAL